MRCEHCKGSGLADKPGPDDDDLLSRVVLSAITIDGLRADNAELLKAAQTAWELLRCHQPTEALTYTVRKLLEAAIAKAENRS